MKMGLRCLLSPSGILWVAFFIVRFCGSHGDLSYSLPEEMERGAVIGNIGKDLGLDLKGISQRNARIDLKGSRKRFCEINAQTGDLVIAEIIAERIDREELCGYKISCNLKYELVLENPLELHQV